MANIRKGAGGKPPPEPDWSDLHLFLAIAETGSLTKAAQRLNTTQPTVSKRLDELEAKLGVMLVVRSLSGVSLTDEGRIVADNAASMSRLVRQVTQSVSMRDRAAAGKVTLACPDALATYVLAPALAGFQRAFPNIRLEVRTRNEGPTPADLSIQFQETKRMDDVAVSLGWQHYAAFASKDYLDLYQTPIALTDAFQHKMLVHLDHREQLERWAEKVQALQSMLDPAMTTDGGVFMVRSATSGAGVAALPTYVAHHEPALVMVGAGEYARARFWVVFDRENGERARVRETLQWIKDIFAPRKNPWFWEEFIAPDAFAEILSR